MESLPLFIVFSSYFFIGCAMVLIFLFIYTHITPHNEWRLIKENNQAAAIAFIGAFIGYISPLASAAVHAVSIFDYLIWGVIALIVQLLVFGAAKIYMPKISQRIENNELAVGIFLGGISIGSGILNAACMSY
ncbi:DUF350 domain-containing protein [Xenorhabdus szentirmaii]|uniref:DUF350 domain-containing protein n=1 Tax=Xenorhabdus szentirmaii TaxID=290112 RepID=UPI0019BDA41F|nr:DUF350 domain-containing protein [Xenorhabdus sp. 5]MBD2824423.1 DUF350 domain-containing protein [Xenorhabdus sp. 5]